MILVVSPSLAGRYTDAGFIVMKKDQTWQTSS